MRTSLAFKQESGTIAPEESLAAFSGGFRPVDMRPSYIYEYAISTATTLPIHEPQRLLRIDPPTSVTEGKSAFAACVDAVNQLLSLRPNWDTYGSAPPSEQAARKAIELLRSLMQAGAQAPTIVPTTSGGIQLEWHNSGLDVEIEISSNGELSAFVERANYANVWTNHQLPADREFLSSLNTVLFPANQ